MPTISELEICILQLQKVLMEEQVKYDNSIVPEYLRLLKVPKFVLVKLEVLPLHPEYDVQGAEYQNLMALQNDQVYLGKTLNNVKNGRGQLYNEKNKKYFQGYWKNGNFVFGHIITEEYFFEGKAVNDQPEDGTLLQQDGSVYKGKFLNGVYNDQDAFLKTPKFTYRGGFRLGRKEGKGRLETEDFVYEGELIADRLEGKGVKIEKATNYRYEGSFVDGILHGEGKVIRSQDDYYHGGFSLGQRDGYGIMKRGGIVYQGGFKNNVLEGWVQVRRDNRVYKCFYENGEEQQDKSSLIG